MNHEAMKSLLVVTFLVAFGYSESKPNNQVSTEHLSSGIDIQNATPDEILHAYLNAELRAGMNGKSKETYSLLSCKDQEVMSEERYLSQTVSIYPDISPEIVDIIVRNISFSITSCVIENGVANLHVDVSVPRFPSYLEELNLENNTPEIEKKVLDYLKSPNIQIDKSESSYKLLKEPKGWRVFLDLGKKKRDLLTKYEIDILVAEAEELVPDLEMIRPIDGAELETMKPNLLSAEAKYKEALSLGVDPIAMINLANLEKQLRKLKYYEQYKSKIQIKNIYVDEAKYDGTGIFGEIKNNTDATFTKVGITIYFLDKNGNPVHEMSYNPVNVTKRSYGDDAIPLKPNYSRKFGVKYDNAPSEWSQKVKVVLSDIEIK